MCMNVKSGLGKESLLFWTSREWTIEKLDFPKAFDIFNTRGLGTDPCGTPAADRRVSGTTKRHQTMQRDILDTGQQSPSTGNRKGFTETTGQSAGHCRQDDG